MEGEVERCCEHITGPGHGVLVGGRRGGRKEGRRGGSDGSIKWLPTNCLRPRHPRHSKVLDPSFRL